MPVLQTPGAWLVFFSPEKGTAGRGGHRTSKKSPWAKELPHLAGPRPLRDLTWLVLFPGPPLQVLRDVARLSPQNSQPYCDSCQELASNSQILDSSLIRAPIRTSSLVSLLPPYTETLSTQQPCHVKQKSQGLLSS